MNEIVEVQHGASHYDIRMVARPKRWWRRQDRLAAHLFKDVVTDKELVGQSEGVVRIFRTTNGAQP